MNETQVRQQYCIFLNMPLRFRVFGFLFLFWTCLHGQQTDNSPYFREYQNHYSIYHWNTSNGLPQSHVSGITQTKNKLLWLSTYNGVVSFDGKRFNSLNETLKRRNLSLFITSITAVGDSVIWASTKETVVFYNKRIVSVHKFKSDDIFIPSIQKYGNDIYFFAHHSVFRQSKNRFTKILELSKNPRLKNHTILTCVYHNGKLNYLTTDGKNTLIVLQNPIDNDFSIKNPKAKVLNISVTDSKLLYLIGNNWRCSNTNYGIGKAYKTYQKSSGHLEQSGIDKNIDFFSSGKTLEINNKSDHQLLNIEQYLQGNELFASYIDHTGNIWLATNSDGIYMFRHYPFFYPAKENALRITNSSHSFIDKNNVVWFDDECKQTFGIQMSTSKILYNIHNVCNWANADWSQDSIAMFSFGPGHNWFNKRTRQLTPLLSVTFPVNYCIRYNKESFILGTPGKLYLWNGRKTRLFKAFKKEESTCNQVIKINDSWFFATSEGVYTLKNNVWKFISPSKNQIASDCRSLLPLKNSTEILIGTAGDGIFLYNYQNGKCTSIPKLPPTLNDSWSMIEDSFGQLWISSNNGIVQVCLNDLIKSFKTQKVCFLVNHYRFESGIQNVEFNSRTPNKGYLRENGDIVFSSLVGPLVIQPQNNQKFNAVLANIMIENVSINGKSYNSLSKKLSIKEGDLVQVTFTLPTFSLERSLQFEYRLKGYRDEWTTLSGRQIILENLPNGNYDLQIQLNSGKRSYSIQLEVNKLYPNAWIWQSLLLFLAIVFIVFLTFRITRYFQVKKNATKNLKQHIKILEIDSLQAQMNPHFVFNCLNTIQFLFMSGNNARANKYLSDFSSLLRLSLELMRESVTAFDKELKATQLYIHLEQLQFDDGFELRLIDNLKTPHSRITTPTMFLQLFVENAIIHGLKKTDEKVPILTITLNENDSDYIFTVADNGPGFSQPQKIGHKSVGLNLLRERFKLKSELYQWNIDFSIKENESVIDDMKTIITITIGKNWNEPV